MKASRPLADFREGISAPAQRALARAGITSLKTLSTWSTTDLLKLHGLGPSAIPPLRSALRRAGLTFSKKTLSHK